VAYDSLHIIMQANVMAPTSQRLDL